MKPQAYLGMDIGGTSVKAGVVDSHGRLLAMAQRSYQPHVSELGHVEIPIDVIYTAAREAAVEAIHASGARIAALSISSQGHTFVSLDAHDQPLHSAIVWYDARASEQAERLSRAVETKLPGQPVPYVDALAAGPKIMWLREHDPALMARARRFMLLPEYFAYRLAGRAVTDPCTATSTGLYTMDATSYCPESLQAADINKNAIAEILMPGEPIGAVVTEVAESWELDSETLVVTGTNDQFAGALGAGNCRLGIVSATAGTCLALVVLTERLPQRLPPGLWGGRFPVRKFQYALAFAKTAGVVLEWFNRELSAGRTIRELDALAAQVPAGSRGILMLPHFDGMISPSPNAAARGAFLNLSLHHTAAEMYRATLEALGYNFRENLELFRQQGFAFDTIRLIGGGARSDVWLQIMADITGLTIERPAVPEAALFGATIIAAVGAGEFSSLEEGCRAFYRLGRAFDPSAENRACYRKQFETYVRTYHRVYEHHASSTPVGQY